MKVYPDLAKLKEPKLKIEYNSFKKNEESLKQKNKIHPFNNKVIIKKKHVMYIKYLHIFLLQQNFLKWKKK